MGRNQSAKDQYVWLSVRWLRLGWKLGWLVRLGLSRLALGWARWVPWRTSGEARLVRRLLWLRRPGRKPSDIGDSSSVSVQSRSDHPTSAVKASRTSNNRQTNANSTTGETGVEEQDVDSSSVS